MGLKLVPCHGASPVTFAVPGTPYERATLRRIPRGDAAVPRRRETPQFGTWLGRWEAPGEVVSSGGELPKLWLVSMLNVGWLFVSDFEKTPTWVTRVKYRSWGVGWTLDFWVIVECGVALFLVVRCRLLCFGVRVWWHFASSDSHLICFVLSVWKPLWIRGDRWFPIVLLTQK